MVKPVTQTVLLDFAQDCVPAKTEGINAA